VPRLRRAEVSQLAGILTTRAGRDRLQRGARHRVADNPALLASWIATDVEAAPAQASANEH